MQHLSIRFGTTARRACLALALALAAAPVGAEDFHQTVSAEPGGTLRVQLDVGSIEVEAHEEPQVRVDARSNGKMAFSLQRSGRDVELQGRADGGLFSLFGSRRVHVVIRVPKRFSVDVRTQGGSIDIEALDGSVRARTSGGEVGVEGARESVEIRTSGGSLRAEDIDGDLEAHTSGGNIEARKVTGRIVARTSGGRIDLRDVAGPVEAQTSGGNVRARFLGSPEGDLRTSGGDVDVVFPPGHGVDLQARTSGGRIDVQPPLDGTHDANRGRVEGRIHGGGPRLELHTSGGNISVRLDRPAP